MSDDPFRRQETLLWICQWTLAAGFFLVGLLKLLVPAVDLQALHLAGPAPHAVQRAAGIVELVGALGVVLPAATGILPRLTPVAAACLSGVSLRGPLGRRGRGGAGHHAGHGEGPHPPRQGGAGEEGGRTRGGPTASRESRRASRLTARALPSTRGAMP